MKSVVTTQDVPTGGDLRVAVGTLVTAAAREMAAERGVRIIEVPEDQLSMVAPPARTVAIGADHGGFRLKEILKPILAGLGLEARDVGIYEEQPADYPDLALQVAELVSSGAAARGIVIDGAGIGSSISANKVPGIRAAVCWDKASARNSREHNDSNVLALGSRLLTATQAEEILRAWIATPFAGGRHQARIEKIRHVEERFMKRATP
jgi:ribose 5-phosphate isomerase B